MKLTRLAKLSLAGKGAMPRVGGWLEAFVFASDGEEADVADIEGPNPRAG